MKATLLLAAVLLALPALADETRAQVEQRVRLAARLISDTATGQRIANSSAARSHHDEGRLHLSLAEEALAKGDLAGARRAADEAMRHLGHARRMVPDSGARQSQARARAEQMSASLERLLDAWQRRGGQAALDDGDRFAAVGLLATARQFGDESRWDDAVYVLLVAERHVLAGMQRALAERELDYTARAATPAEELQLELDRHQALADLVPLATQEFKPRADALALIERYGEASRALRQQALARRQQGDLTQALADVRNAQLYLQRALGAAGVAVPASTGGAP